MSSAYFTKRLKVPDEFPEILKSFTREILRNQPSNIYEFGANYFAEMSAQANMLMADGDDGAEQLFSAAEMEEYLSNLFHESDSDGNGWLDPQEFKEIMNDAKRYNVGAKKGNPAQRALRTERSPEVKIS